MTSSPASCCASRSGNVYSVTSPQPVSIARVQSPESVVVPRRHAPASQFHRVTVRVVLPLASQMPSKPSHSVQVPTASGGQSAVVEQTPLSDCPAQASAEVPLPPSVFGEVSGPIEESTSTPESSRDAHAMKATDTTAHAIERAVRATFMRACAQRSCREPRPSLRRGAARDLAREVPDRCGVSRHSPGTSGAGRNTGAAAREVRLLDPGVAFHSCPGRWRRAA